MTVSANGQRRRDSQERALSEFDDIISKLKEGEKIPLSQRISELRRALDVLLRAFKRGEYYFFGCIPVDNQFRNEALRVD